MKRKIHIGAITVLCGIIGMLVSGHFIGTIIGIGTGFLIEQDIRGY